MCIRDRIHANGEEHKLKPHYLLDTNVAVLKLFPGIQENVIATVLGIEGLKAIVLETYGSGNAPRKEWFIRRLCQASAQGIVIVNVTQCSAGMVEMERYETGYQLLQAGVVSGYDSTMEMCIRDRLSNKRFPIRKAKPLRVFPLPYQVLEQ